MLGNKAATRAKKCLVDMRMLRWISDILEKIMNECVWEKFGVAPIKEKMVETCLWWFGHMGR